MLIPTATTVVTENEVKISHALSQATIFIVIIRRMIVYDHLISPIEGRVWRNIICNSFDTLPQILTPEDIIQASQNSHYILPLIWSYFPQERLTNSPDKHYGYWCVSELQYCRVCLLSSFSQECCLQLVSTDSRTVFIGSEKDNLSMDMLCNMCVKLSELEISKSDVVSPEWRLYEHIFV